MDEFDRERPLFDGKVHVLVQQPDRDDRQAQLTIRLLNGQRTLNSNQKERVLRIEITDDEELESFFLYVWSVSEEEFHDLKHQQRLLVDYPKFAANFMDLLTCCLSKPTPLHASSSSYRPESQAPLSYLAVLNTHDQTGQSTFSIVETNAFKKLTHLSLHFTPGGDTEVKSYLAARLRQTMIEKKHLIEDLAYATSELKETKESEETLRKQVERAEQKHSDEMGHMKMLHGQEMTKQKETSLNTLHETERMYTGKIDELRKSSKEEIDTLHAKVSEYEGTIQSLRKTEYQHQVKIEQLEILVHELESTNKRFTQELDSMKAQNKVLDQDVFSKEKTLAQNEMKMAALQQQVADKEVVITKTTELLQAATNHKLEIEETLKMYKSNHTAMQQKLELSIAEINKGNQIIEQIQNENHSYRSKLKMKSKILKQQELIVQEKQHQKDQQIHEIKALKNELLLRDDQITLMENKNEQLVQKLEESNKLLASNQQVITWLNKEINEAQLTQHKRTAYSTAFTFQPPLGATSTSNQTTDSTIPRRYGLSRT